MKKPSLRELEEYLRPGVFLHLNDGSISLVIEYDKNKRLVTLEGGQTEDLFALSNSIKEAVFINGSKSSATEYGKDVLILEAALNITHSCKYHIYPEVILAYLQGDTKHYIYEWCKNCESFGSCKNIDLDYIKKSLKFYSETRILKAVKNNRGQTYYLIRKDRKRYPKPRSKQEI